MTLNAKEFTIFQFHYGYVFPNVLNSKLKCIIEVGKISSSKNKTNFISLTIEAQIYSARIGKLEFETKDQEIESCVILNA